MAKFTAKPNRLDPYKNFKFRIKWDGRYVAGVSKVSVLNISMDLVTYRKVGDPSTSRVSPNARKFEPITLERGVTHDKDFENWANHIFSTRGDSELLMKNYSRNIIIELLNEEGSIAKVYKIYRCWVSEYVALPELDANGHAVAIEHMTLQNEGWERDVEVSEPTES